MEKHGSKWRPATNALDENDAEIEMHTFMAPKTISPQDRVSALAEIG
jgi:hypothetical protein